MIKALNDLYYNSPALHSCDNSESGFEWVNALSSDDCMLAFIRKTDNEEETLLVVANMAGVEREYEIGVPADGRYNEI